MVRKTQYNRNEEADAVCCPVETVFNSLKRDHEYLVDRGVILPSPVFPPLSPLRATFTLLYINLGLNLLPLSLPPFFGLLLTTRCLRIKC